MDGKVSVGIRLWFLWDASMSLSRRGASRRLLRGFGRIQEKSSVGGEKSSWSQISSEGMEPGLPGCTDLWISSRTAVCAILSFVISAGARPLARWLLYWLRWNAVFVILRRTNVCLH